MKSIFISIAILTASLGFGQSVNVISGTAAIAGVNDPDWVSPFEGSFRLEVPDIRQTSPFGLSALRLIVEPSPWCISAGQWLQYHASHAYALGKAEVSLRIYSEERQAYVIRVKDREIRLSVDSGLDQYLGRQLDCAVYIGYSGKQQVLVFLLS